MDDATRISRRDLIGKLVAAATAVAAFAGLRARAKAGTIDQQTAHYLSHPTFGNTCSGCVHFISPDSCQIVAGTISPHGSCKYYSPKMP